MTTPPDAKLCGCMALASAGCSSAGRRWKSRTFLRNVKRSSRGAAAAAAGSGLAALVAWLLLQPPMLLLAPQSA
eukprot:CAMPEP_0175444818 /NCGR_PEP_ID=MMETSP0095-20121207/59422_1 /TAXON_ID=311494 /ORGANISM="Alexandrium monilatum, Strain CCMP3105" /LENGTH=73 /DNA_ID=CAMNT_0016745015 /DNA_START=36 /DNA_END=254 /DNA_ORIENTATION=+